MATATKETSAIANKAHQQETAVEVAGPNRREFLYYIWGASLVMLLGQSGAFFVWYALPRFKEGEFGGTFVFPGADVPNIGSAPLEVPEGRIWLSNGAEGLLALYAVCTHLGCLPGWSATEFRFECPCHGSRFELNGDYITGPAPRGMDRYSTTIIFTDGSSASSSDGSPIPLQGREIAEVRVDTGSRTNGPAIGS